MTSDSGTIIFYNQNFGGAALPEGGDSVSEAARVRAVPVGVYEWCFRQQPQYELDGALLFNAGNFDPQNDEQPKQFEIAEDITEIERILTIRRTSDAINLESVEIIPLDWRENPLEFSQPTVSESQRTIRYLKDPPVESLKLRVSAVNVFEVENLNAIAPGQWQELLAGTTDSFN